MKFLYFLFLFAFILKFESFINTNKDDERSEDKYQFKQILSGKNSKQQKPISFHNTWEENEKVRKEMEEDRRNIEESLRHTKRNLKSKLEEVRVF